MARAVDPVEIDKEDFACWLDKNPPVYNAIKAILYRKAILDRDEMDGFIDDFLSKYGREIASHGNLFRLEEYMTFYEAVWKGKPEDLEKEKC